MMHACEAEAETKPAAVPVPKEEAVVLPTPATPESEPTVDPVLQLLGPASASTAETVIETNFARASYTSYH